MRKIRSKLVDDWEFDRLLTYVVEHPAELAAAGREMLGRWTEEQLADRRAAGRPMFRQPTGTEMAQLLKEASEMGEEVARASYAAAYDLAAKSLVDDLSDLL